MSLIPRCPTLAIHEHSVDAQIRVGVHERVEKPVDVGTPRLGRYQLPEVWGEPKTPAVGTVVGVLLKLSVEVQVRLGPAGTDVHNDSAGQRVSNWARHSLDCVGSDLPVLTDDTGRLDVLRRGRFRLGRDGRCEQAECK